METSKIGHWLQVGANIGILAGLIMVGLQINQASYLVRNQLVSDQASDRMSTMENMLGENPAEIFAKAVTTPDQLTDAELVVMDSWMTREIIYARRVRQLVDSNIYPSEAWENHRGVIDYAFGSKFGRKWWEVSRSQFVESDPRVVELVDSVIENLPNDDDWKDYLAEIQSALHEE
ncbi:MAG: hypothetical protein GKR90_16235 [Pseudomonadales bacterium]|nr:hypothetical protein [Pseudomonadales bacterium]